MELLKIRLQLQRAKPGEAGYTGPLAMLRRVLREEGRAGARRAQGHARWDCALSRLQRIRKRERLRVCHARDGSGPPP